MPCRYDFGYHTSDPHSRARIEDIVAAQKAFIEAEKYQEAIANFNTAMPLAVPPHYDTGYYKLVATYQLALALSFLGQHAEAARHMNEAGVMSAGDREDLFFSEHQYFALQLREWQLAAIEDGKPGVMITALPRSASAFLSYAIADILNVPVLRASIGSFPHHVVVKNWAFNIAQGGCVTHDHFSGVGENTGQLVNAGVQKIYVQIRDPRAAAWSYFHHVAPSYAQRNEPLTIDDIVRDKYYPHAIRWIDSWIEAKKTFKESIDIKFIPYDTLIADLKPVLKTILTRKYGAEINKYMEKTAQAQFKPIHFRKGQKSEWREAIPQPLQNAMWEMTSESVKALLEMNA